MVDLHLGNLSRLSSSVSRSISAESPAGGAGGGGRAAAGTGQAAARDLGRGWKVSPAVAIEPGETRLLADIEGPGSIQHVWMGVNGTSRHAMLRFAWDGCQVPAVECPVGDFFACGWGGVEPVSSLAVCMNPRNGFNCWWEMPFRASCRITVENIGPEQIVLYYQVDYAIAAVPEDAGYFHAQFHRSGPDGNRCAHPVLDEVKGRGQYVGTSLSWQPDAACDRDDGRVIFLVDGTGADGEARSSTLPGYFGRWGAVPPGYDAGGFRGFSSPYCGLARATGPEGAASPFARFSLYRWHIMDPVRFATSLRVLIIPPGTQVVGIDAPPGGELASVAFWYQQP
jgi:hypothetical protein